MRAGSAPEKQRILPAVQDFLQKLLIFSTKFAILIVGIGISSLSERNFV